MRFILIYLLVGVVVAWFIESIWDELNMDVEPNMGIRLGMILLWPLLALAAILGALAGALDAGGKDNDNDNTIGPGYGT